MGNTLMGKALEFEEGTENYEIINCLTDYEKNLKETSLFD